MPTGKTKQSSITNKVDARKGKSKKSGYKMKSGNEKYKSMKHKGNKGY